MNRIGAAMRWLASLSIALAGATGVASAQDYPAKSIRMVVPFPPGGFSDVFARIIGGKMHESWGQQVVVDNRPGAGGNIGADIVAKSPPDGYSLVMGTIGTHAINATLFSRLPYDPIRDFVAVAFVVGADGLLVVHPSLPVRSTKELIALARSKPGALTYASAGAGTTSHLAGELFKSMTKTDITHVPYKGNVPAITDLLSGQTTMLFATLPTVLPQVQANRLRPLAVLGKTRSAALPDMPTLSEAGLKDFEVSNWTGVFAPAGTPSAIVTKLNTEIVRIMRLPDVQERLPRQGLTFVAGTPQQFAAFVRSEKDKWGALVKAVGARVD
ncbi:MAG TPA: tripartite tricarboxylate transporter substrate binding protein [Burkholderiales bacterium]|nr:tripartite tricarboxylate transporter substrate binding protein [Burkholderiales bacterium]